MLPAERCNVSEQVVGHVNALCAEVLDGAIQIDRIPMHDGGGQNAQS